MAIEQPLDKFKDATLEDIVRDPHKYGAPTFEEYLKSPNNFKTYTTEDDKLGLLDQGPQQIRNRIRKLVWVVKGVSCESPEKAQRVARDENIDLRYYKPELVDVGGQMCDIHLIFNKEKQQNDKVIISP